MIKNIYYNLQEKSVTNNVIKKLIFTYTKYNKKGIWKYENKFTY